MPIIERPYAVGDTVTRYLTGMSAREAQEHRRRVEEEAKQKKQNAMIGAAVGTLGVGLVAAPALGLAGSAATFGAGGMGPPTAATAGLLGSGGSVSLGGALTLANLGAKVGGYIADEDYGGLVDTVTSAGLNLIDARKTQELYGFMPSKEGRKSLASLAEKAGTTLDQLEANAAATGTTVSEQLGISQQQARDLDLEDRYYGAAASQMGADDARAVRLGIEDDLSGLQGYEAVPDDATIAEVQTGPGSLESVDADEVAYRRSGGLDGASYSENMGTLQSIKDRLHAGVRGRRRAKQLSPVEEFEQNRIPGSNTAILRKPNGTGYQKFEITPDVKPAPWGKPENKEQWFKDHTTPDGRNFLVPDGYQLKSVDNEEAQRAEWIQNYTKSYMQANDGEIPSPEQAAQAATLQQRTNEVLDYQKSVSERAVALSESDEAIVPETATDITKKVVRAFGQDRTQWPFAVQDAMEAVAARAEQTMVAAAIVQQAQAVQAAPPPGSAASAEQSGREAGKAIRGAVTDPIGTANKAIDRASQGIDLRGFMGPPAPDTGPRAKIPGAVDYSVGAMEGLLGIERKDNTPEGRAARLFANVQAKNIAAGIDELVSIIGPDGQVRQIIKGSLTPERIAELKAAGFTIPGIDDAPVQSAPTPQKDWNYSYGRGGGGG